MNTIHKIGNFLLGCSVGIYIVGCDGQGPVAAAPTIDTSQYTHAIATLKPTKDSKVSGVVTFLVVDNGVRVIADIDGLKPGNHGFHVHEKGDCSAPDGSSAGAHFDPEHKHQHASPENENRHVGDLGNVLADNRGHAHYDRVDKVIVLGGENTVIGRAIIVHSDADDFKTQPTGNAGGRLACGVIQGVK